MLLVGIHSVAGLVCCEWKWIFFKKPDIFKFGIFLSVAFSESRCMFTSGFSSTSCNSFFFFDFFQFFLHVIYPFSIFVIFFLFPYFTPKPVIFSDLSAVFFLGFSFQCILVCFPFFSSFACWLSFFIYPIKVLHFCLASSGGISILSLTNFAPA